MSLQLRPDEMLTALQRMNHPQFQALHDDLATICLSMAETLVHSLSNLKVSINAELWDGQMLIGIAPIDPSLPIPEPLQGLDDGGWE